MKRQPILDSGWAWAVVVGGFINNLLSMGLYRSGGIIYVSSTDTFRTSRSIASWIPMVTLTVVYLMAPVGTALCRRFSYSLITFAGGLLASFGMLVCYLATRVEFMFVGWGLVFGIGSSIAFFPTIALVGQYFKEKRPLANGIVLTGGALGAFSLPPLLEYLVRTYGLNGTALITCGVTFHYCITSGLLLLVERRNPRSKNQNDKKSTKSKAVVHYYSNEVSLEDEITHEKKKNEVINSVCHSGLVGEEVSDSVVAVKTDSGISQTAASENNVDGSDPKSTSKPTSLEENEEETLNSTLETPPLSIKSDAVSNGKPLFHQDASTEPKRRIMAINTDALSKPEQDFQLHPSTPSEQAPQSSVSRRMKFLSTLKSAVDYFELRTICNFTFLINCSSNSIQTALFMGLVTILPDYGADEIGVSRMEAAYFVSASAVADLVTRFISGWILSKFQFDKVILCFFVVLVNAAVFVAIALVRNYIVVMVCSVLAGTCFAFGMILYFEILASCQSVEKYPLAFGLSEMMKSPLLLLAAASVGTLKDATGSYSVTLFVFCSFGLLATSLWIVQWVVAKKKTIST